MRHGRSITAALVVAATMAIAPAYAAADPSPLTDDDFAGGTPASTWAIEPGVLRLKPAASETFDAFPAGWSQTPWATGGGAVPAGGSLTVDGTLVTGAPAGPAPQTLEFRATFGNDRLQHVGLATTQTPPGPLNPGGRWAIISTGDGGTGLFARTVDSLGMEQSTAITTTTVPTFDRNGPNTYRIEWTSSDVKFYVNDTLLATPTAAITEAMSPVASDLDVGGEAGHTVGINIKLDWLDFGSFPASGTFVSRALQADDPHTVWGTLTSVGTGVSFRTRSGNTPTPDSSWSAFQALGSSNAIQSPSGRYIQYEATLSGATPSLDEVELAYAIDSTPPTATIADPQVSGTSATVSFSSPDADIASFECSLDGAAYAPCASPKTFAGLAPGGHTVSVRPIDKAANTGAAVSKSFTIAAPAQPGGGSSSGTPSGGNSTVQRDTLAPKVTLAGTSLRASKRGTVKAKVACPATETTCKITVQLMRGKSVAAKKTVNVAGGKTKTVTLQLTKATRKQLASHHSLTITAVVAASDAAGNRKTTKKALTLRG
jgi:hypothetical protein